MTVVMKGGNSGNREDALAPVPDGGASQPVLDTSTGSGKVTGAVHYQSHDFQNKVYMPTHATPDFLPTGGTIPEGSTDVQEQGLPSGQGIDWTTGTRD